MLGVDYLLIHPLRLNYAINQTFEFHKVQSPNSMPKTPKPPLNMLFYTEIPLQRAPTQVAAPASTSTLKNACLLVLLIFSRQTFGEAL